MIDLAYKHEQQIRELMFDTWYDEKYMFYNSSDYRTPWESPKSVDGDWNCRQFVSIDNQGEVIGVIGYNIDRTSDLAMWFRAINFTDNKMIFGMDLAKVIDDIFCKFNMRKLEFSVIVGNPVEKSYDKMIAKFGGVITGIKHKHSRLIDGQYYDLKEYEIFREDYISAKQKRSNKNAYGGDNDKGTS